MVQFFKQNYPIYQGAIHLFQNVKHQNQYQSEIRTLNIYYMALGKSTNYYKTIIFNNSFTN